jgi:hypothetical protein
MMLMMHMHTINHKQQTNSLLLGRCGRLVEWYDYDTALNEKYTPSSPSTDYRCGFFHE